MIVDKKNLPLSIATAAATWTLVLVLIDFGLGFLESFPGISVMLSSLAGYPFLAWLLETTYEAISIFVVAYLTGLAFVKVYSRSDRR